MKTEIAKLLSFEITATPAIFTAIFGPDMGAHLWNKFTLKAGRLVTLFVRMLDTDNEAKFYSYLDQSWKN